MVGCSWYSQSSLFCLKLGREDEVALGLEGERGKVGFL